jgi:hypothetical protein
LQLREEEDLGIGTGALWAIRRTCVSIRAGARDERGYAGLTTLAAGDRCDIANVMRASAPVDSREFAP